VPGDRRATCRVDGSDGRPFSRSRSAARYRWPGSRLTARRSEAQSLRRHLDASLAADGHPDLQGVWLNNSATPLERPKALEGRPSLTDEKWRVATTR
jgi:hypothetical protein